jgi:hypothetical protein
LRGQFVSRFSKGLSNVEGKGVEAPVLGRHSVVSGAKMDPWSKEGPVDIGTVGGMQG